MRSSVGSVTTLINLLRMLYSRAGDYPLGQPADLIRSSACSMARPVVPERSRVVT